LAPVPARSAASGGGCSISDGRLHRKPADDGSAQRVQSNVVGPLMRPQRAAAELLPASERIHQPIPQRAQLGSHGVVVDRGGLGHGSMNEYQFQFGIDIHLLAVHPAQVEAPVLPSHRPEVVSIPVCCGRHFGRERVRVLVPIRGFDEVVMGNDLLAVERAVIRQQSPAGPSLATSR